MATSFLEKNLEDIIFESDRNELFDRGLSISGKLFRQFNLGNYGIADLVTYEDADYEDRNKDSPYEVDYIVTVFELKRKLIDFSTLAQAIRYVAGLIFYNKIHYKNNTFQYKIVLIGSEIEEKPEFLYFPELILSDYANPVIEIDKIVGIEFIKYSYDFNGINFETNNALLYNKLKKYK